MTERMTEHVTERWEALLGCALIGSERRADLPPPLAAAPELSGMDDLPPPERILAAASVLGSGLRAGWRPPPPPDGLIPPVSPDERPLASPEAMSLFEVLFGEVLQIPGGADQLLAQWLDAAATAAVQLPPAGLAALLDRATVTPALRPGAAAAGGIRGQWLAHYNPSWYWVLPTLPTPLDQAQVETRWAAATRAERLVLLRAVRAQDPDLGRRLVASALEREPAAERAALLAGLDSGRGSGDEDLLEAALDDRSAAVRDAALSQLDHLPTSARAQRMAARLPALVTLSGRARPRLVLQLPGPPDAAARRDGVGGRGRSDWGERAWWLFQVVAAAPLATWTERFGRPPPQLIRLGAEHPVLLEGWARAAFNQGDQEWAAALVAGGGAEPALARVLDPGPASALLIACLAQAQLSHPRAAALLNACRGPWSAAASEAVLDRLAGARGQLGAYGFALAALARNLDPEVAPSLEEWLATVRGGDRVSRGLHGLPHVLGLRRRLDEVFGAG